MDKIKIWRWAPYLMVGFFQIALLAMVLLSPENLTTVNAWAAKSATNTVLVVAVSAYILGNIVWGFSVSISRVILFPAMLLNFRRTSLSFKYHTLRVKHYQAALEELGVQCTDVGAAKSRHYSSYKFFSMQMLSVAENGPEYLKAKVTEEWQSCTFFIAIIGAITVAVVLHVLVLFVFDSPKMGTGILSHHVDLAVLVVLYILAGCAFVERNRLLARDVAYGVAAIYTGRKKAETSGRGLSN